MPREKVHRGRREEKKAEKELKRKRVWGEDPEEETPQKKSKSTESEYTGIIRTEDAIYEEDGAQGVTDRPFYGMLEDEEQEYFRRADELLELNDFPSQEERSLFLSNVYHEADGKELKIACSQSCSRLMERLILLSTVEQKKKLFGKFAGNFVHMVQHRFASHCCEMLFIQSAPIVTKELIGYYKGESYKDEDDAKSDEEDAEREENEKTKDGGKTDMKEGEFVSMENLFLYTLNELEGQMTFLLTDRFASHTLRVLLIVLSGQPFEMTATKTLLQSRRKEKIGINGMYSGLAKSSLSKRAIPESFQFAIEKIISDTVATMDTAFIQVLATHPTGNPSLQLLLELELTNHTSKKGANASQKTIISALLPDDITQPGSESAIFINGILYDPIGSRLLEIITTFAPGKLFKQLYNTIFKDRIAALARNEIASYVAIKALNRLSKEDLEEAVQSIIPQIEGLITRSRTQIIKTLFERCHAREADTDALTTAIAQAYGLDPSTLILKMSEIDLETITAATSEEPTVEGEELVMRPVVPPPKPKPTQLHGSLLAQSMLAIPGPPCDLIQAGLLALPPSTIFSLSLYTTTAHLIQSSLRPTKTNTVFRRKLISSLITLSPSESTSHPQSPVLKLALSPTGSHTLDSILDSTTTPSSSTQTQAQYPLFSLSERIASLLLTQESALRESFTGRIVWRNWHLDLFKRRRGDWVSEIRQRKFEAQRGGGKYIRKGEDKGLNDQKGGKSFSRAKIQEGEGKSAIELAREKFAKGKKVELKEMKGRKKKGRIGENAVPDVV
ncbi:hypothetical protein B7494_g6139 [Chlorociboria aeruginascens]|nr:hypothetical protein B7494_g6139 [Chlorociboria aeruginascens]